MTTSKKTRQDSGVKKAKIIIVFGNEIISGNGTFTGRKYKDGEVILEATLIKQIPQ